MSGNFFSLAQPGVRKLAPYVPGKPIDELARELGIDPATIVKLASNENPRGASPLVQAAIKNELANLTRYPDGDGFALKSIIAQNCRVNHDQITLGNGSSDILEMVARAYLAPGLNAVLSEHTFAVYPLLIQAVGAQARVIPPKEWGHDLKAMLDAVDDDTRLIFLDNPNNPTGSWIDAIALDDFMQDVPEHVLVVLDEAYMEYAEGSDMPDSTFFLRAYPNLLVSRTFSKAYGLAALRVGYGLSSSVLANVLNRVRQPFNVNSLALVAACAALKDDGYLETSRALNTAGMEQLLNGFRSLGLSCIPSKANFVCVDLGIPAAPVYEALLREGVIVRPLANYGMPNHLRVTTGLHSENKKFLLALGKIIKG